MSDETWIDHFSSLNLNDPSKNDLNNPQIESIQHFIDEKLKTLQIIGCDLEKSFGTKEILDVFCI